MEIETRTVPPRPTVVIRGGATTADLATTIRSLYDELYGHLRAAGVRTGQNVILYLNTPRNIEVGVEIELPFDDVPGVERSQLPGGRVARAVHVGPYTGLGDTHTAVQRWCQSHGLPMAGPSWEVYRDWNQDESKLETEVFYLLA
jgi:effector-binding domain-containing protein